jgi:hypothetical protein
MAPANDVYPWALSAVQAAKALVPPPTFLDIIWAIIAI